MSNIDDNNDNENKISTLSRIGNFTKRKLKKVKDLVTLRFASSDEFEKRLRDTNGRISYYRKMIFAYNTLFNTIFLDYELTPKPLLKNTYILCVELLDFIDHVCKKHNLEYWIDYGVLLGAVRHGGFIPWDDDIDLGMMRKDYNKFLEVFEDELREHDLYDDITLTIRRIYNADETHISAFAKIIYLPDDDIRETNIYYADKMMYAGLDIFPYDYINTVTEDLEERHGAYKEVFFMDAYNNMEYHDLIDKYYKTLDLTLEKRDYFLPGVEGTWGGSLYDFDMIETDKVFPLGKISFEGREYPCPKDCKYYLEALYGEDYMIIPPNVRNHSRQHSLRKVDDAMERFDEYIEKLSEINKNF